MRWSRPAQDRSPAPRMTEAEVLATARQAAEGEPFFAAALANPISGTEEGRIVWTVASMTMDSSLEVHIDDATGVATLGDVTQGPHVRPTG